MLLEAFLQKLRLSVLDSTVELAHALVLALAFYLGLLSWITQA